MKQSGHVIGTVEYRAGDGPRVPIPRGPVDIETTATEVTLTWTDGDAHGAAAMPLIDFKRYVSEGAIRLEGQASERQKAA